jgi:hypothetical protein
MGMSSHTTIFVGSFFSFMHREECFLEGTSLPETPFSSFEGQLAVDRDSHVQGGDTSSKEEGRTLEGEEGQEREGFICGRERDIFF